MTLYTREFFLEYKLVVRPNFLSKVTVIISLANKTHETGIMHNEFHTKSAQHVTNTIMMLLLQYSVVTDPEQAFLPVDV